MPKAKNRTVTRRADEGDAETGRRIRARRLECHLSQTTLGTQVGVTFQQIQKYEKGVNRVGSSRLAKIATALGVSPSYFFPKHATTDKDESHMFELASDRGAIRILTAYASLPRAKRLALIDTAEAMA